MPETRGDGYRIPSAVAVGFDNNQANGLSKRKGMAATPEGPSAQHWQARWAGLLYVVVVVTGTFSLGVAPDRIFVGDTPQALATAVAAQDWLLRVAILAEATCYIAFGCLALALYALLRPVQAAAATIMAMLVLISVPLGFTNLAALVEIQRMVEAGHVASSAETVVAIYDRYRAGLFLQSLPWGLWLLPLGVLAIRSGFIPRLLGAGVILAGLGYVAHFTARLLMDGYRESIWPNVFAAPRVAEILMAFWLLVFGARRSLWRARSSPVSNER